MKRYWTWAVSQWDRIIGWTCVGGGALLTLSGALSVSRAVDQLDQLSYLASGAAIGLFLLGVGAILILTADLRDEWGKLDEVASLLRQGTRAGEDEVPPAGSGREISLPDTTAPATAGLRVGLPALMVAGVGILVAAAGVNQSHGRVSALRWSQLSAAALTAMLVVVALVYLRGRQTIARGVAGMAVAVAGPSSSSSSSPTRPAASHIDGGWYVVEGSQRYHAASCDLLRFSEVRPIPAEEASRTGLTPCPICR